MLPRSAATVLLVAVSLAAACAPPEGDPAAPDAGPEPLPAECSGPSPKDLFARPVINGQDAPTAFEIDPAQQLAVGALLMDSEWGSYNFCTATLVAPTVVVTAAHCVHDEETDAARDPSKIRFGIGPDMRTPHAAFQVASIHYQPQYDPDGFNIAPYDIAILKLATDATAEFPGLRPIRLNDEPIPTSLIRTGVQAVGYGLTSQDDRHNTRRHWTTLDFQRIYARELVVFGHGETSVCFGDSGGPLLRRFDDGDVRVVGIASWVAGDCLSQNHYCRVDANMGWVESSEIAGPLECGALPAPGVCDLATIRWCEDGVPKSDACGEGELCDPGDGTSAPTCVPDPCLACGEHDTCERGDDPRTATCVPDPCRSLTWQGACEDGAAVWCEGGTIRRFDCGACGLGCDFVGAGIGYFCK